MCDMKEKEDIGDKVGKSKRQGEKKGQRVD